MCSFEITIEHLAYSSTPTLAYNLTAINFFNVEQELVTLVFVNEGFHIGWKLEDLVSYL